MTLFQLIMLGATAYFAFKIYEHVQSMQDTGEQKNNFTPTADAFSPHDAVVLEEKAQKAFEEEDYPKAIALLSEAHQKQKDDADILYKLGYFQQRAKQNEEALQSYKQALELDQNNEYIHNSIASLYREEGEFASARMYLNNSLELAPQNPLTYFNYGNLLVDTKEYTQAIEMYEKALELKEDFVEAQEEIAKLKEIQKDQLA